MQPKSAHASRTSSKRCFLAKEKEELPSPSILFLFWYSKVISPLTCANLRFLVILVSFLLISFLLLFLFLRLRLFGGRIDLF